MQTLSFTRWRAKCCDFEMQQRAHPPWPRWPSADPLLLSCCSVHHGLHSQLTVLPWVSAGSSWCFWWASSCAGRACVGHIPAQTVLNAVYRTPLRSVLGWVPVFRLQLDAIRAGGMSKKLEQRDCSFSAWLWAAIQSAVCRCGCWRCGFGTCHGRVGYVGCTCSRTEYSKTLASGEPPFWKSFFVTRWHSFCLLAECVHSLNELAQRFVDGGTSYRLSA